MNTTSLIVSLALLCLAGIAPSAAAQSSAAVLEQAAAQVEAPPVEYQARAEELSVCTGYNPDTDSWLRTELHQGRDFGVRCPDGYAVWTAYSPAGEELKTPAAAPLSGVCCPLPPDALSGEFMYALSECPAAHVVTGGRTAELLVPPMDEEKVGRWRSMPKYLRCTKINTERYQLGPPTEALFVDWGSHFSNVFKNRTSLSRIPPAFRYAVGRRDRSNWLLSDCVGYPWGSVLTAKLGGRCNFLFRRLQYAGRAGDPPAGAPVPLYPNCRTISSPFDPRAECIK